MTENEISKIVIDTCIRIHKSLGPGLLESVYEAILAFELRKNGLLVEQQKSIPLNWQGQIIEDSYRADLLIDSKVIIELKSIEKIQPVHNKQLLTYLRISGCKLGLLINFNTQLLKDGIHRIVNNL